LEKRVVLLVILCVVVFVGWSMLMRAIGPVAAPPAPPTPAPGVTPPVPPAPKDTTIAPAPVPAQPTVAEEQHELANPRIRLVLTNIGAGIREATIPVPGHRQKDMHLLRAFDSKIPHLAVSLDGSTEDPARGSWTVVSAEPGRAVTYRYQLRSGVVLEKTFTLIEGRPEVDVLLTMVKPQGPAEPVRLRIHALTGLEHDSQYRYEYYGNGFATTVNAGSRTTETVTYDSPQPTSADPGALRLHRVQVPPEEKGIRQFEWFGLRNRYAAAILLAKEDLGWVERVDFKATTQEHKRDEKHVDLLKALALEAGLREASVKDQQHRVRFSLSLVPIRSEDLAPIPGAESFLISYGCWGLFNIIGKLILALLGFAYAITGNYGWAIILTTLLIRLAVFPLTRKSQTSMAKMAELQPKLNLIRERYADDKARQQQETMKLFKEQGVNPLSGCFPIMMQLPVFIGLYSVLDISLVFRQAPFLSWMTDLSQPDGLVHFQQPINLLVTSVSDFNLLPIIMTVTWFLQAYWAPRPTDPQLAAQQRMMLFMPVVFGLLCYSLASGLSLYLFVNSLLAMIEQKLIKKYFLPVKAPTGPPAKA
jgi:YidC/Oxa1 family membrane protein insertase